jgi:hypothetical protein
MVHRPNGVRPGAHTAALTSSNRDTLEAKSAGLQDTKSAKTGFEESSPPDEGMCRRHPRPMPGSMIFKIVKTPQKDLNSKVIQVSYNTLRNLDDEIEF